jgi:riboflavin biosynthesis pyrimidine reductase
MTDHVSYLRKCCTESERNNRESLFMTESIRTLFATEAAEPSGAVLPDGLRARYDGNLSFPPAPEARPYFIANFVSTLDGVVSFNLPGQSDGAQISGSNEEDRFIMGLLRASADAVMVGSGTLHAAGPQASWLPESVCPAAKDLYQKYRTEVLRKSEYPLVVIVTATGRLDLASTVFHTPRTRVLILTTEQGKHSLSQSGSDVVASVEVKTLSPAATRISASAILTWLRREAGVELLLHEAGPTLFGEFLEGGFADELFLTVAPQIAGRPAAHPRPGIVADVDFSPATAPWWEILSAKKAAEHLFLRYQVSDRKRTISKT